MDGGCGVHGDMPRGRSLWKMDSRPNVRLRPCRGLHQKRRDGESRLAKQPRRWTAGGQTPLDGASRGGTGQPGAHALISKNVTGQHGKALHNTSARDLVMRRFRVRIPKAALPTPQDSLAVTWGFCFYRIRRRRRARAARLSRVSVLVSVGPGSGTRGSGHVELDHANLLAEAVDMINGVDMGNPRRHRFMVPCRCLSPAAHVCPVARIISAKS
jgi:hypothetical protein